MPFPNVDWLVRAAYYLAGACTAVLLGIGVPQRQLWPSLLGIVTMATWWLFLHVHRRYASSDELNLAFGHWCLENTHVVVRMMKLYWYAMLAACAFILVFALASGEGALYTKANLLGVGCLLVGCTPYAFRRYCDWLRDRHLAWVRAQS